MDRTDLKEIVIKSVSQMLILLLIVAIAIAIALAGIIYIIDPEGVQSILLK